MIGRKSAVGMALLCALVFSAFAASSASAVNGRTAFTCVKTEGGAGFKDAHCKEAVASGATFKHAEIAENKTTDTHITNEKTNATTSAAEPGVLKATFLGVENEVSCAKVFGHSKITNKKNASGEHYIHGEKTTLHYTECEVKKPAGCVIPNKTLLVEGVTGSTEGQNGAASIVFKPEVGNVFITITYEKCTNIFLNGKHPVEGSVTAKLNGATIEFDHNEITASKTLTFGGSAAGLQGKVTISQAEKTAELGKAVGATGNPISSTQVNT
jgi:hypothetical protein